MVDGVDARHDMPHDISQDTAHEPAHDMPHDPTHDNGHDDVGEAVRGLWCALVPAAGAIGDELVRTMLQSHPEWYVDSDPTSRSEWFASVHEHVVRGIRTMAGIADPDERAIHLWRHTGRLRARQGVPMERVLSSYNMGTRLLWEALLDEAGRQGMDPGHEVVRVAGRRLWSALDIQNGTMAEAYREERDQVQRRDQHRILSVLDGLLEGRGTDPEFAAECREVLGLDPDEELVCVVVQAEGPSMEPLRAPQEQLERFGVRSHWHVRGGTHVGLVPMGHLDVARLDRSLESSTRGRVGVTPVREGLAGVTAAYRLACRAAETAPPGTNTVVHAHERLPEVLLAASPEIAAMLVEETLGPVLALPERQAEQLLATLTSSLAHGNSPKHAAEELYCHRNTVIYRLRQIEELTGHDLSVPRTRLHMALALMVTGHWARRAERRRT
jgi:hypothetical protein